MPDLSNCRESRYCQRVAPARHRVVADIGIRETVSCSLSRWMSSWDRLSGRLFRSAVGGLDTDEISGSRYSRRNPRTPPGTRIPAGSSRRPTLPRFLMDSSGVRAPGSAMSFRHRLSSAAVPFPARTIRPSVKGTRSGAGSSPEWHDNYHNPETE